MQSTLIGRIIISALIAVLTGFILYVIGLCLNAYFALPISPVQWLRFLPLALPLLFLGYVFLVPRPSTHVCRRLGVLFVLACMASVAILVQGRFMFVGPLLLILPGVAIFFLPGRMLTLLPLMLSILPIFAMTSNVSQVFAAITPLIVTIAAFSFPLQRRIIEFWRPSRLPRRRKEVPIS